MRIIALANQKGGVGKSTSVVNISAILAEKGHRVLVIDMDPQSNASQGLGVKPEELNESVYHCLVDVKKDPNPLIIETDFDVDILPSNIDLAAAEVELVSSHMTEFRLQKVIDKIRKSYDFILIDCPPSLGVLTTNAMVATRELIVPVDASFYSLAGLAALIDTVIMIRDMMNTKLKVSGAFVTMFAANENIAKEVFDATKDFFEGSTFETPIRRNVRLREAPSFGQPIIFYDNRSSGADDYRALTDEIISKTPTTDEEVG